MRIPSSISWALLVASLIGSALLWRELGTERQRVAELGAQLEEARAEAARAGQIQQVVTRAPESPAVATTPAEPRTVPMGQVVRAVQDAASAAMRAELARRSTESREVRLARASTEARRRNLTLATDLGLSVEETDALFDILGEMALRREAELMDLISDTSMTEDARAAAAARLDETLKQQEGDAIAARLGARRQGEVKEYLDTQPSRLRVTNFSGMLSSRGVPLTDAQSKSLTKVMVVEQRRQEAEVPLPTAGTPARVNHDIESDRRILSAAAEFLTPQELGFMKAKFEELWEGKRAALKE